SGLMEAINYSFYNSDVFDQIQLALDDPLRQAIPIQNPLNQDFANMRTTLIPSLLENVSRNNKCQVNDVQFFEFAKVFNPSRDQRLPQELERVAGVMAGSLGSGIYGTSRKTVDFFDIKGIVEGVLDMSSVFGYGIERVRHPTFHPGRCASIHIGGKSICLFGEVHPQVGENYDLINQTYVFEFDFDRLVELAIIDKKFEPIPIYPSIQRDLAILVSKDILSDQPLQIIRGIGGDLVDSAYLFDLYVGNPIPEEKKSLAYTIEYRSQTETLTDDVIDEIQLRIIARLEEDLKAELRT
nr:phenylalanine--tRNA ligase subunit beta [Candidatus Poribacteria bacterium]